VPGSSFNVVYRNHFRVTFLPEADDIAEVFRRIDGALERQAQAIKRAVA
jgi:alanine-synthesizing transaminase